MSWKSISRKTSESVERGGKAKEHTTTKNRRSKIRPASATKFPIVLAEWPRNHNQVVKIVLTDYKGRKGINIRVWFRAEGGDIRPSRTGIWLPLERLSEVRKGLRKAKEIAAELGLIEQETSS
jgi:hypothetical protein